MRIRTSELACIEICGSVRFEIVARRAGCAAVPFGEPSVGVRRLAHGALTKDQVANLYLGRSNHLKPVDLPESSSVREASYKKATGRDPNQSGLVTTGLYRSRYAAQGAGRRRRGQKSGHSRSQDRRIYRQSGRRCHAQDRAVVN